MTVRLLLPLLFGLSACRLGWEKVDWQDTAEVPPCERDDDCVVSTSCCDQTYYCHSAEQGPIVCQLGCYVPQEPTCRCEAGACTFW